jgi:hypothetical protein
MARVNVKQTMPSEISVKRDKDKEQAIQEVLDQLLPEDDSDDSNKKSKKTNKEEEDCCCVESEALAVKIRERFKEAESSRREIEQRWLKDLRQYRGQYDPEVLSRIHTNRSKAFIRITRNKVKTVDSRLVDLLFPANGDSNWSIKPTTIPQLSPDHLRQIMALMQQAGAQNITRDMLETAIKAFANDKAKSMGDKITDQLCQMNYRETLRNVIHSGNQYGTGILKGPMIMLSKSNSYNQVEGKDGAFEWKLESKDELLPYIEHVPVWDFFPDMSSYRIEDCRYAIQRHKMTKRQLLDLSKRSDFLSDKISDYLEESQEGDWQDKYFDTQLKEIGDRSSIKFNDRKAGRKYEILEYWGFLDASDLSAMGASIPEELVGELEIAANVWVLGDTVIKAAVSHLGDLQWPFFLYYYDKDETSIFGEGIPTILRDIQELVNSAFRAMLDNAAISAGPQFEVNLDLLSEDEDPTDIHPFKVWLRTGEGADANAEAVRVKEMPSHTGEFLQMCKAFEDYADEVTTIPRYMWGDNTPGIGRTASGLSMMLGSANITIKDQVKNFDDGITKPFISAMYHWNMKFTDDDGIKGDFDIRAEGMASLVAKEVYSQSLMQFANITNNPAYSNMVRHDVLLRCIVDALELTDHNLVLSDQEIKANNQLDQQKQQQQQAFMLKMTDTARQFGVSPTDMINNMQAAFSQQQQLIQQGQQAMQAQQQMPANAQGQK